MASDVQVVCKMIFYYPTLRNDLVIKHLHAFCVRWQIICHKQKYGGGGIFDSNYCFYITKFKYHLCYYLNLFAILAKGTVWQSVNIRTNASTKRKHQAQAQDASTKR